MIIKLVCLLAFDNHYIHFIVLNMSETVGNASVQQISEGGVAK